MEHVSNTIADRQIYTERICFQRLPVRRESVRQRADQN